jgi:hypothetical protein
MGCENILPELGHPIAGITRGLRAGNRQPIAAGFKLLAEFGMLGLSLGPGESLENTVLKFGEGRGVKNLGIGLKDHGSFPRAAQGAAVDGDGLYMLYMLMLYMLSKLLDLGSTDRGKSVIAVTLHPPGDVAIGLAVADEQEFEKGWHSIIFKKAILPSAITIL